MFYHTQHIYIYIKAKTGFSETWIMSLSKNSLKASSTANPSTYVTKYDAWNRICITNQLQFTPEDLHPVTWSRF